jgi:hypothetical protein
MDLYTSLEKAADLGLAGSGQGRRRGSLEVVVGRLQEMVAERQLAAA